MTIDYTREKLIEICERAIVQEKFWRNRDSADAHRQLGEAWAYLKAGCDFIIRRSGGNCSTDDQTIWIEIEKEGFNRFEYGKEVEKDSETYYLPTEKRLEVCKDDDWY